MSEDKYQFLIEKYSFYKHPDPNYEGPQHCMQLFGFEIGGGWYNLIEDFSKELSEYLDKNPLRGFYVIQVKEKFGELRIYCETYTPEIESLISKYEKRAENTCAKCGDFGKISVIRGWLHCLCEKHTSELLNKRY